MAHDARAVANSILDSADALNRPISHLALQKLLYFAHGLHLAARGQSLIRQPLEAWEHGPVVRIVYEAFRNVGGAPITTRAERMDPITRELEVVTSDLPSETAWFVEQVVRKYAHLHPLELRRMSHLPGSPWHQVWHAPNGRVTLGMRIDDEDVKRFFAAWMQMN